GDRARDARADDPLRPRHGPRPWPEARRGQARGGRQRPGGDRGVPRPRGGRGVCGLGRQGRGGGVVPLVAATGAGKTTTLRAISGLLPVARGEIAFEGRSLLGVPAHRRAELGIALVPEGRELWPQLTVRENLELGAYGKAARRHRSGALERVYELFPVVKERSRQVAGRMSGGGQQMVAIARALMTRP